MRKTPLRVTRLAALVAVAAIVALLFPAAALAKSDPHLSAPRVPSVVLPKTPFGVAGSIESSASGPFKLLFYQNVGGAWVLRKTLGAKVTVGKPLAKYAAVVALPYTGLWRVGAAYSGNATYTSAFAYTDFTVVAPRPAKVTATVDKVVAVPNSSVTLTVTVRDQLGHPLPGARIASTWFFKPAKWGADAVTNASGIAHVVRNVGAAPSRAYYVIIDVEARSGGQSGEALAVFRL